jgi:hypothetical protein
VGRLDDVGGPDVLVHCLGLLGSPRPNVMTVGEVHLRSIGRS